MIELSMDDGAAVVDHLESMRQRILAAIREGMTEGVEGLGQAVVERLDGDPITSQTGRLREGILSGERVTETDTYIKGMVTTATAEHRNLGLWLEYGTKFPTRGGNLSKYPKQFLHTFAPANAQSASALGHGAFRIEPRPFFNPTFEAYYPTILDVIQQRIAEAIDGQ